MSQTVLLFYKYIKIDDPKTLMDSQRNLCQKLGITGRMIIAEEGINGTFEGTTENTEKYIEHMRSDLRFTDVQFKKSKSDGKAFPKLSIKVRNEVVSAHLGPNDLNPNEVTGKYIHPEELHDLFKSGEEFHIVDMRNGYEQKSGHFKGSINSEFENFRDLPKIKEKLSDMHNKKIITVCTGGIRCEKASGYLVKEGYTNVYQLYGGIQSYIEKYPGDNYLGKLYVFDQRVLLTFNDDPSKETVIGKCDLCRNQSEIYVNCANLGCHKHFIVCQDCLDKTNGVPFCSNECEEIGNKPVQKSDNTKQSDIDL